MINILVAGSSGFYGNILVSYLVSKGFDVYGADIVDSDILPGVRFKKIDLTDYLGVEKIFPSINFDVIVNLATKIDFDTKSQSTLFQNNIKLTRNLANFGVLRKTKIYLYTSSNSVFLGNKNSVINNDEIPMPIDSYGKSKIASEKILKEYKDIFSVVIFRCPNIIDSGRLGMLTILFELMRNGSTLWVIDGGKYKHQCLYAQDLNRAIELAFNLKGFYIFNIGADDVETFKEMFGKLVLGSKSRSRVRSISKNFAIAILKLLHFLRLSPMGPYQFRMLTSNFEFETQYIKSELGWQPTLSTTEILEIAYQSYISSLEKMQANNYGANGTPIKMGILRLLKYVKI